MIEDATLYYHSPCFDGVVSAVLASDFLETHLGWGVRTLVPIGYKSAETWLSSCLPAPAAVVDFLYHPDATFWADHHRTTFKSAELQAHFKKRAGTMVVYDGDCRSCALLLWNHLYDVFGHRTERFRSLVDWATRIDAAEYETVEQAVLGNDPALVISQALAVGDSDELSRRLVAHLRDTDLSEVAALPEITERSRQFLASASVGLDLLKANADYAEGVVSFDVEAGEHFIPRYAPYLYYPDARYSIGLIRRGERATITAMRNPWREFRSVDLGRLFEGVGGGGHHRVGSVVLTGVDRTTASRLLTMLRSRLARGTEADAEVHSE